MNMIDKLANGTVGEDTYEVTTTLSEEALDAMIKMEEEKVEEEELENLINEAEEADEEAEEAVEVSDRLEAFASIINEHGLSKPLVLAMDPDGSLRRNNLLPDTSRLSDVNVRDELSQEVYMGIGDVAKRVWEGIKNIWKKIWGFIKKIGSNIATLFRAGKTKAAHLIDKLESKDEVDEEKLDKKDLKVYEHWFSDSGKGAMSAWKEIKDSIINRADAASSKVYTKIKEIKTLDKDVAATAATVTQANNATEKVLTEIKFKHEGDNKYKLDDELKKALGWDEAILTTTTTSLSDDDDKATDYITGAKFSPKDKSQETKTMKLKELCPSKNKAIDYCKSAETFFKEQKLMENALNSLAKALDDGGRLGDSIAKSGKFENKHAMPGIRISNALFHIARKLMLRGLVVSNKVENQKLTIAAAFAKCMK